MRAHKDSDLMADYHYLLPRVLAQGSAPPFTGGITITSTNLDTGGGAGSPGPQNPRTGSRYAAG
jgi:hypothetical protein